MTNYQVAQGFDNPGGFVKITPQPRTDGISIPRRIPAVSGRVKLDGRPFVSYEFSVLLYDQYTDVMVTQFGFTLDDYGYPEASVEVTVSVRANDDVYRNFNGIANPTLMRRSMGWWADFKIEVVGLEAI